METLVAYLSALQQAFFAPNQRLYWMYILPALALSVVSYRLYAKEVFSLRAFWRYIAPKGSYTSRSAIMDYWILLLTPLWYGIVAIIFVFYSLTTTEATILLFEGFFGVRPMHSIGAVEIAIYSLFLFIAFDFAQYLAHYLNHRCWFLWEFHKIHHSAEVLNPLTAYRFHPIDILWTGLTITVITGLCNGVVHWWWNHVPNAFQYLGLQLGVFIFYFTGYNLRHSHIWLCYPPFISHILISPAQHQIHHSVARKHWDKNMGFMLAIWDWAFGTLYVPKTRETLTYGIGKEETAEYQKLSKVYTLPFLNIAERIDQKGKKHV